MRTCFLCERRASDTLYLGDKGICPECLSELRGLMFEELPPLDWKSIIQKQAQQVAQHAQKVQAAQLAALQVDEKAQEAAMGGVKLPPSQPPQAVPQPRAASAAVGQRVFRAEPESPAAVAKPVAPPAASPVPVAAPPMPVAAPPVAPAQVPVRPALGTAPVKSVDDLLSEVPPAASPAVRPTGSSPIVRQPSGTQQVRTSTVSATRPPSMPSRRTGSTIPGGAKPPAGVPPARPNMGSPKRVDLSSLLKTKK